MFYAKSTGGFYTPEFHANIPNDAVEIAQEQYQDLLNGQTQGKEIKGDNNGLPILVDPVDTRTYAEKRAAEYPSIGDQMDALWKGGDAAAEMLAQIQAVKAKYPKGA
jgi:hypothetical protein